LAYQEEEQTKLKRQAAKQAITQAMQGRWREAIATNRELLEQFPNDADAHNRLGRAHMELGEYPQARQAYERALQTDPYNTIAKKNLDRLVHLREMAITSGESFQKVEPHQFIEEVGKAGMVNLYHLGTPEVLARTVDGSKTSLRVDGPNLVVENSRGEYLGQVEPRHGPRLIRLMEGGNRYTSTVVRSTRDAVTVIIREVYQNPSQVGRLSFPPKGAGSFRPYVGDRIIRREQEEEPAEKPSYTIIGGDDEDAEMLTEESEELEEEIEDEEQEV
jgi:hypothetical protein